MRRLWAPLLVLAASCGDEAPILGDAQDASDSVDASADRDGGASQALDTLLELARSEGLLSFVATATSVGLGGRLSEVTASTTVFAPTDQAFQAFGTGGPIAPELIENILLGHLTDGAQSLEALGTGPVLTFAKTRIPVNATTAGGARLEGRQNLEATNGLLHVVRDVLPSWSVGDVAEARPDLAGFGELVSGASTLAQDPLFGAGPLTVFVPSNAALEGVEIGDPDSVLSAHFAPGHILAEALRDGQRIPLSNGGMVTVRIQSDGVELATASGSVRVVESNIRLANGVVHVIDGLLEAEPETRDLITTLRNEGLVTMATLLERSGLAIQLGGPGPFTVLAPTNEALTRAQDGLQAAPALLLNLLLNHVVAGRVDSAQLARESTVENLGRRSLALITDRGGGLLVGGAPLSSRRDIPASNGIIHVIESLVEVPTLLQAVRSDPELAGLGTLAEDLDRGLGALFLTRTGQTLLAPTNEALARVETSTAPDARLALFQRHLVPAPLTLSEMVGQRLRTRANQAFTVQVFDDGRANVATASGAVPLRLARTNVRFRDGTVHFLEALLPAP